MRIVAVADTHTFERDLSDVPEGDVFIHAGDMMRSGKIGELFGVAAWIRSLPHRHKIIIAGNHDWCFARDREAAISVLSDGIVYLEDGGVDLEGVRFWGSPWQPEFNDWAFNLPRGAPLADKWALIPEGLDVLITHGPPLGIGDASSHSERLGCEDLLRAVQSKRPRLHLFGHIHEDGGYWEDGETCFANVTTWECERRATVIDLHSDAIEPIDIPPRGR